MKKTITLVLACIAVSLNAQTVDFYYDGPESNVYYLYEYPNDASRLIQARWISGTPTGEYLLEEITNGNNTPISIPMCNAISAPPISINGSLFLQGETDNFGDELFYYDGTNSYMYDLNSGSSGSDILGVKEVGGEAFIIANTGMQHQLVRFDSPTSLMTVTNETVPVRDVCAVWGDTIYYSTAELNAQTSTNIFRLQKAMWNGVGFDYALVREIQVPLNLQIYWRDPVIRWGRLFLQENEIDWSAQQGTSMVLGITPGSPVDVMTSFSQPGFIQRNMFVWDDKLYTYVTADGNLYSTMDGSSFSLEYTLSGQVFISDKVAGGNLYFTLDEGGGAFPLVQYDGGVNTLFSSEGLTFRQDDGEVLFMTEYKSTTDNTHLHFINTTDNNYGSILVGPGSVQFTTESSLFFEDKFTFAFQNQNSGTNDYTSDVMQISSASGMDELSTSSVVEIYPNPQTGTGTVVVSAKASGEYQIMTMDGRRVQHGKFNVGDNHIQLSGLSAGVYSFIAGNQVGKLVVE